VTRVGADTTLARMIELVERAQSKKTQIQHSVDRISAVFVPVVLVVSFTALLGWGFGAGNWSGGLFNAIAVLVVACPCAMGLAVPTAILVGSALGARYGVLIRDPAALEQARGIGVIVFDKTGTLTKGHPVVTGIDILHPCGGGLFEDELLGEAASLEQFSDHPVARAVREAARARSIRPEIITDFESLTGLGVRAALIEGNWLAGSVRLFEESGGKLTDDMREAINIRETRGHSVMLLWKDHDSEPEIKPCGMISFMDQPKNECKETIQALHDRNVSVRMLTGDNRQAAVAVAIKIGIREDQVLAGVHPEKKAEEIRTLMASGNPGVAMVGDGINDAPALAEADLGIAMGDGTDIAMEAGDIILVSGDPVGVVRAIDLSRNMVRVIHQNLFWAFVYNITLIPLAAFGVVPIIAGAAAMALSDVCVMGNSLRLYRMKL
jgi:Cu+-exporting ATPase